MATFITYADLGQYTNLKTEQIRPVIDLFGENNAVDRVVCRLGGRAENSWEVSAVPVLLHYLLAGAGLVVPLFSRRQVEEVVFDYRASRKLVQTDVVFFHPARFTRSIEKADKLGAVTVGLATTAYPNLNDQLEAEERERLTGENINSVSIKDKSIYNRFDYLIAFSEFAKKTCIDNGIDERRVFVAEPDIDTINKFYPENNGKNEQFTVVFPAASTSILKGLQYLLKAWQNIGIDNKRLIVLGERSGWPKGAEENVEEMMREDGTIDTLGIVNNPETYFQNADVVVYPSLTEGFGRASLEAMACGTPVIVTENAKGIVEGGETGFVVPIRDSKALREKIIYLYNHENERKEMGRRALQATKEKPPFSERVYEIYKEIRKRKCL